MVSSLQLKKIYYLLVFALVACSTGHCRRGADEVLEKVEPKPPTAFEQEDLGSIRVSKPDGSLQCNMREGLSLEDMASRELKDIQIINSEKMNDGLMRIQACGTPTGMLNVYTIRHQDLRKAQLAGFSLVKEKN
jgi:hypothetical protein